MLIDDADNGRHKMIAIPYLALLANLANFFKTFMKNIIKYFIKLMEYLFIINALNIFFLHGNIELFNSTVFGD